MILLFLLMILAALSAYYALTPLVYSARKTRQMKEESRTFYENTELVQQDAVQKHIPMPYENLYLDIRDYNKWLYATRQESLDSREAYQAYRFDLTEYGLSNQVFPVCGSVCFRANSGFVFLEVLIMKNQKRIPQKEIKIINKVWINLMKAKKKNYKKIKVWIILN